MSLEAALRNRVGQLTALLLLGSATLNAQEQSTGLAVWIGTIAKQQSYAGADYDFRAVPLLFYENAWLRLAGLQADLKVPRHDFSSKYALSGGLRLRYEDDGYEPGDSTSLAGMQERKASAWIGVTSTWHTPLADVNVEWMSDASSNSKGQKARMQIARRFGWQSLSLTPRAQVDWLDGKYVDYYYGVRPEEATLARPAYLGRSAITQSIGLRVDYSIAAPHQVFIDFSVSRLPTEITNSPIIERRTTPRAFMGYLYRF